MINYQLECADQTRNQSWPGNEQVECLVHSLPVFPKTHPLGRPNNRPAYHWNEDLAEAVQKCIWLETQSSWNSHYQSMSVLTSSENTKKVMDNTVIV